MNEFREIDSEVSNDEWLEDVILDAINPWAARMQSVVDDFLQDFPRGHFSTRKRLRKVLADRWRKACDEDLGDWWLDEMTFDMSWGIRPCLHFDLLGDAEEWPPPPGHVGFARPR